MTEKRTGSSHGASAVLALTAAFDHTSAEEMSEVFASRKKGYIYSRILNPTVEQLENRMTELEGGIGAVACASGMAAISHLILALAGPGDTIAAGSELFGGTYAFFQRWLPRFGIRTVFFDAAQPEELSGSMDKSVKLIFSEGISNPGMKISAVEEIARIAREWEIPLVVDNTLSPLFFRPGRWGADIVIHSTTKYIDGHGRVIGGCIIDLGTDHWNRKRYTTLREYIPPFGKLALIECLRHDFVAALGACLSPYHASVQLEGLKTLRVRIEQQCRNAMELARFLNTRRRVRRVLYPGLDRHPQHERARRYFGNMFGGMLSFEVESQQAAFRLLNRLQKVHLTANLGDCRTLALHPASTIFHNFSPAERKNLGVTDGLIRVSLGIEPIDTIIGDFAQALEAI